MSQEYDRYAVDQPFRNHRIHTEHNVSSADIDRILRPILEAHSIASDDYNPENLSYKIGEKTIQLSVNDYERDDEFEDDIEFGGDKLNIQKTIFIKNHCSIKGTEILIDFLKSFQREFDRTFFETVPDVFRGEGELQYFYADEELYDPITAKYKEREELYEGLDNE